MTHSNHLFTAVLAALLALTLFPLSALALTENMLEPAPELSLAEEDIGDTSAKEPEEDNRDDYIYHPSPRELPARGTVQESEELNLPRLTDAELAMARELLAAREAGEQIDYADLHYAAPEKVFGAGVYPLDPEAFGGNTFYVILPYCQMSRDQVMSLIAAFEELGIPFDPDSLDSTNCVRGNSLLSYTATRRLSYEEQTRMDEIKRQIRRGIVDRDTFPREASCRSVLVQLPGYAGLAYDYLEPFCFYPYRPMTDSELATFAFAQETGWEIHPAKLEKQAREYARMVFPLPLSMTTRDETRYAYSEKNIEFRNYFTIDPESCKGMYASPEETPCEVMVEQELVGDPDSRPAKADIARILIDYPARYEYYRTEGEPVGSKEELITAAQRWAENYLLIPEEDILSGWVFDEQLEDLGIVQYRLLTTDWLVCLEMYESNAEYSMACIYNREYAVEFDDWNLKASEETGDGKDGGTGETAWEADREAIDRNARQYVSTLLNLPQNMTTESITRQNDGYVQYRADYTFDTEGDAGKKGTAGKMPESMIVYQTPRYTKEAEYHVECLFFSYHVEWFDQPRLSDSDYRAAAWEWAYRTLRIPGDEILADWTYEPESTSGSVTYRLTTGHFDIYLQMTYGGDYCWCGIYPRTGAE